MQSVKINNIEYSIPLSWDECNYKQAIGVIKNVNDKAMQLNALTSIPYETILALNDLQARSLFTLISFTEDLEVFNSDMVLDEYKEFDFGNIKYGDAEMCRTFLTSEESGYEAIVKVINHLFKKDINEMPFLEVIGTANFFLSKSIVSMIVTPNLVNIHTALNKSKRELSDYKILGALERTLNSQGQIQLETQ